MIKVYLLYERSMDTLASMHICIQNITSYAWY